VPLHPWMCQLLQRKEGGGWGWIWDGLNQSRRGGLWYDIETGIQSFVAHCDKIYCAKCCDRSSEDEDYHETVWINCAEEDFQATGDVIILVTMWRRGWIWDSLNGGTPREGLSSNG
jgi:hypothetical protein